MPASRPGSHGGPPGTDRHHAARRRQQRLRPGTLARARARRWPLVGRSLTHPAATVCLACAPQGKPRPPTAAMPIPGGPRRFSVPLLAGTLNLPVGDLSSSMPPSSATALPTLGSAVFGGSASFSPPGSLPNVYPGPSAIAGGRKPSRTWAAYRGGRRRAARADPAMRTRRGSVTPVQWLTCGGHRIRPPRCRRRRTRAASAAGQACRRTFPRRPAPNRTAATR